MLIDTYTINTSLWRFHRWEVFHGVILVLSWFSFLWHNCYDSEKHRRNGWPYRFASFSSKSRIKTCARVKIFWRRSKDHREKKLIVENKSTDVSESSKKEICQMFLQRHFLIDSIRNIELEFNLWSSERCGKRPHYVKFFYWKKHWMSKIDLTFSYLFRMRLVNGVSPQSFPNSNHFWIDVN